MKIGVYTIDGALFEGKIDKLITQTPLGEITVLNNHLPLISSISGPEINLVDELQKSTKIRISSGFIEVRPESEVIILANPT